MQHTHTVHTCNGFEVYFLSGQIPNKIVLSWKLALMLLRYEAGKNKSKKNPWNFGHLIFVLNFAVQYKWWNIHVHTVDLHFVLLPILHLHCCWQFLSLDSSGCLAERMSTFPPLLLSEEGWQANVTCEIKWLSNLFLFIFFPEEVWYLVPRLFSDGDNVQYLFLLIFITSGEICKVKVQRTVQVCSAKQHNCNNFSLQERNSGVQSIHSQYKLNQSAKSNLAYVQRKWKLIFCGRLPHQWLNCLNWCTCLVSLELESWSLHFRIDFLKFFGRLDKILGWELYLKRSLLATIIFVL